MKFAGIDFTALRELIAITPASLRSPESQREGAEPPRDSGGREVDDISCLSVALFGMGLCKHLPEGILKPGARQ